MVIILDADVVIQDEKDQFDLQGWLRTRGDDDFEMASVTVAELWHGVERASGQHRAKRLHYLRTIVSILPVISYTEEMAYTHARIWAQLEAEGKRIGYYDLIVAATALERGGSVATFNKRDFGSVPSLDVLVPA